MFQAQTANWEETQEKMSQLVSRPLGFLVYVVECFLMNVILFPVRLVTIAPVVLLAYTPIFAEVLQVVARGLIMPIPISQNALFLRATSAIAVDKKVCLSSKISLILDFLFFLKVTGFKIVRRTTTVTSITNLASNARLAFLVASSRLLSPMGN